MTGWAPLISFLLMLGVGASCLCPASASAVWRERPKGRVVAEFAKKANRALIWSISLPDSAAAGKRYGRDVLEAASVRADTVLPKNWARDFASRLFDARGLESPCQCDPVRRPGDSTEVVAPVVESLDLRTKHSWFQMRPRGYERRLGLPACSLRADQALTLAMVMDSLQRAFPPAEEERVHDRPHVSPQPAGA